MPKSESTNSVVAGGGLWSNFEIDSVLKMDFRKLSSGCCDEIVIGLGSKRIYLDQIATNAAAGKRLRNQLE
jgi:hypothetical protein